MILTALEACLVVLVATGDSLLGGVHGFATDRALGILVHLHNERHGGCGRERERGERC